MKISELLEAKSSSIVQKFDALVSSLQKELRGSPRRIYETDELEKFLQKFASKNKLSCKKERVNPKSVGDQWSHVQGGNKWEISLEASDNSAIIVSAYDSNGDLSPFLKLSVYGTDGENLKSDTLK